MGDDMMSDVSTLQGVTATLNVERSAALCDLKYWCNPLLLQCHICLYMFVTIFSIFVMQRCQSCCAS